MDDADDVIEVFLIDGEARETMLPSRDQDVGDGRVVRDRDNLGPRHHDLTDDAIGELHRAPYDHALALLQDALPRRDSDKHLQLLFAVNVHVVARADPSDPEDRVRASVHEPDERVHHAVEEIERVGAPERESERALDREVLRCQLPHHDVQIGDDPEGQGEREDLK